jgi:predicted ATPase/DNA-binding winged helix-turn-helix (wHTH) protein
VVKGEIAVTKTVMFDPSNQLLVIEGERAQISPKAFAVLTYLYEHYQQLVTKEALLNAVWPKVFVTDAVLKVAVGELRKVLDDHPKQPTYIETVHRRGYRFIGELTLASQAPAVSPSVTAPVISTKTTLLIGRDAALQQLSEAWASAQSGNKQLSFVSAEAGVGKTALVQGWLGQQFLDADNPTPCLLANAACFDQHGSGEPYLPVLNALSSLLKAPQSDAVKQCLRQFAPSWYIQIPSLLTEAEQATLKQELFGVTTQRMLREFVDFIEALSQQMPLLLCIEDLHWCDAASLQLIMALAQRQSAGRYMLLGSFRSSVLQQDSSPLKGIYSQLMLQQQCQTLSLTNLDNEGIAKWLARSLPDALQTDAITDLFCRYTEGNPLLLNAALEHLQLSGLIPVQPDVEADYSSITPAQIEQGISGGLKHLLSLKTANLDKDDRQVLEAASVSAAEFATESLAAVLQRDVLEIEEACEDHLLHEQWLSPVGSQSWPDGSISESYRFWHQLYRQYFYETLSAARCRHYHLRFAERLLSGYQGKVSELASQLAYHFDAGGDFPRALAFSQEASDHAAQCFAYREAITHISKVIELSQKLDDSEAQLAARKQRCAYLLASGQLGETITEYQALIQTSQTLANPAVEIDATLGLADALFWVDRQACLQAGKQAVALSESHGDANAQIHTKGKLAHFSSVVEAYQPAYAKDYEAAFQLAQSSNDAALQCVHYPRHLYYLIIRSQYQEASVLATSAMQVALDNGDAVSYLSCQFFHAWALFYQGKWGEALGIIDASLALAAKNEHGPWVAHFTLQKAWLLLQAADYKGAKQLCLPIYEHAKLMPPSSLYFFSVIILLQIEVMSQSGSQASNASRQRDQIDAGTSNQDVEADAASEAASEAGKYVAELTERLANEPNAIDWVLRFPLHQGLAEYYLQHGQWDEATAAATTLKAQAESSGEQTYAVMGEYFLARIVLEQNGSDQQGHIANALATLQTSELPVISWRIHALNEDWQQSAKIIRQLLSGLASAPELQTCFEQSPAVQRVLKQVP